MEKRKKCSCKKHSEINAISHCLECDINMCNKCSTLHEEILESHHKYNINENINDTEIFTGYCKEEKHKNELEFYCKSHNQLCCAACISKIKTKYNGQHTDCDVCLINEIQNLKKDKLTQNLKTLEEHSNTIEKSINELKDIFENINKNKEELKIMISKIFTQIRNTINQREDEILIEVDQKFDNLFFKEDIIHLGENLPNKIKIALEKGKIIEKEWNGKNYKLNSIINDCIDIEKKIEKINDINKIIEKCNLNNSQIHFFPEKENDINNF